MNGLIVGGVDEMLHAMLHDCETMGDEASPRGYGTRELLGWSAVLLNPRDRLSQNKARDLRVGYAAAHVAWNLRQGNDDSILFWNPNGRWIQHEDLTFYGANYGQRIWHYLHEAMHLLQEDTATRRAWVPIWKPEDMIDRFNQSFYSRKGKDVPCTLGFGLRNVQGSLDMEVVMRSQSIGVAAYDLFLFTTLQELVANTLDLDLGVLRYHALSLHYYLNEPQRMEELQWYRDNLEFESKPMRKIDRDIEGATEAWCQAEELIRLGGPDEVSSTDLSGYHDEMIQLMIDGYPR